MMYGVLHSEAHVCVWYCSAKEQVLALQYHTQTPLSWLSIHHIQNMLTHKKYLTSFVKNKYGFTVIRTLKSQDFIAEKYFLWPKATFFTVRYFVILLCVALRERRAM